MSDNKDNHGFSVSVAQEIGVHRAIMLQHFRHLQIAFVDGEKSATEIWVKRSRRALTETYPYLSEKEIRGCLDRLERDDYIRAKVDNALNYDRTKSYQLSKKGWELLGLPASAQKANREQKASDKRAKGFDKKANDNLTKGPMNIGSCSSLVTSIVECEHTPARAENFDNLEEEKNKPGKVPPPAEAAAPTHMVTEIAPADPHIKVIAPFVMPTRVDTVDEAEDIIMQWAQGDGRESVRKWYDEAARNCTAKDVKDMVGKFAGVYLTIGDEGKRQRMAQDPLQFFKYTFKIFLKNEKSYGARVMPGASNHQTPSVLPRSLQSKVG